MYGFDLLSPLLEAGIWTNGQLLFYLRFDMYRSPIDGVTCSLARTNLISDKRSINTDVMHSDHHRPQA